MATAPELLNWARDTQNAITASRGKARRGEIELDPDVMAMLLRFDRELVQLLNANKSTDPSTWVVPE